MSLFIILKKNYFNIKSVVFKICCCYKKNVNLHWPLKIVIKLNKFILKFEQIYLALLLKRFLMKIFDHHYYHLYYYCQGFLP